MNRRYATMFDRLIANSVEDERTGCWIWTGRQNRKGYAYVTIRVKGKPKGHIAHRVMAELVLKRKLDSDKETIEHTCQTCGCICPYCLAIASRGDNSKDAHARRLGRPRLIFKPLVDPDLYVVDRLVRSLPVLKSELSDECPF